MAAQEACLQRLVLEFQQVFQSPEELVLAQQAQELILVQLALGPEQLAFQLLGLGLA